MQTKKLIIFDLDGTLLNTIADLAQSTNYALGELGFPLHEERAYNFMVGNGINKLIERALPEGQKTGENIAAMREKFITHYSCHNADKSLPYPGIPALLADLQRAGHTLAVASNKYQAATEKLAARFFPDTPFVAVLGQREGILPKPHPAIVYEIINAAGTTKEKVFYIGDSGVDMQTAANSGVTSCGVTWGFRPRAELEAFAPDYIVDRPEEISALVCREG